MKLHRPPPQPRGDARPVDRSTPPAQAAAALNEGQHLLVTDHYSTGAEILAALGPPPSDPGDHHQRRAALLVRRAVASRLLAPIQGHRVALAGARPIGFLAELYPELDAFTLPFPQVQELHGAWERYQNGVPMPVLGHRLHPFYGTYLPERSEHLELLATWLQGWRGPRGRAVDVGTGSGVLALMLARAGFSQVLATDDNPNAVESLRRELTRLAPAPPVQPRDTDLLVGCEGPFDLILFNPPWLEGPAQSVLDHALFFEPGLFSRFFDQALPRLAPDGRIVLVFSSVLHLVQPDRPHPIQAELDRGRLRLVDRRQRKARAAAGRRTRERVEVWELAV